MYSGSGPNDEVLSRKKFFITIVIEGQGLDVSFFGPLLREWCGSAHIRRWREEMSSVIFI